MLDDQIVAEIAGDVVRSYGAGDKLERVIPTPTIDSQGLDAIRLTLVLKPAAAEGLTGREALDLLVGIQQGLYDKGEERLPIIEYATEQELAEGHDDIDDAEGDT